ncbi:MAG: hypothetical protein ACI4PV_08340 [Butyricicoccus sp.]
MIQTKKEGESLLFLCAFLCISIDEMMENMRDFLRFWVNAE